MKHTHSKLSQRELERTTGFMLWVPQQQARAAFARGLLVLQSRAATSTRIECAFPEHQENKLRRGLFEAFAKRTTVAYRYLLPDAVQAFIERPRGGEGLVSDRSYPMGVCSRGRVTGLVHQSYLSYLIPQSLALL